MSKKHSRKIVQVVHSLTINGKCPHGDPDTYAATIKTSRMIPVEVILEAVRVFTIQPIYQEELTRKLSECLACKVRLEGVHSGVKTTCTSGVS